MATDDEREAAREADPPPAGAAGWLRRQAVWLCAALAAGAMPLLFIYVENAGGALTREALARARWLPAVVVAVSMVAILRLRDLFFAGTEGTGIPQAMAALKMAEGPLRARVLSWRIAAGKTLLLTLGLLSGQTIGREGPSVHVSACCLYLASRYARFPGHLVERGLILAGGAAGIAAAFNTPVAAIVFAFEEIGRSFEKSNAGTIVRTVVVACLVCWAALGNYLFYGRLDTGLTSASQWLLVPLVGAVAGLLGGGFARAVIGVAPLVRRAGARRPWATAAGLGLAVAALGLISDGLTYGGGFEQARAILMDDASLPAGYPLAKAAACFTSLVSAIPGGLFDPSLTVGAALGQLTWPYVPPIERQAFVLLVMGAYFAGVVQSPITAALILVEMTSATSMALPLLAATNLAYAASRLVCPTALYEALAENFLTGAGGRR